MNNIFWVHIDEEVDGINEAQDLCRSCCERAVEKLKLKHPDLECQVDGGWNPGHEIETPAHCDYCGVPLCGYLLDTYINPDNWTEDERCLYDEETHAKSSAKFDREQNTKGGQS